MKPRSKAPPRVTLVSVYRLPDIALPLLYQLLEEREPYMNISHHAMPSWEDHCKFVAARPYSAWYLVKSAGDYVGSIYLTHGNEIGIGLLAGSRGLGFGPSAVRALMRKHGRQRYLANINPLNQRSIDMFERMGFRLIQHTYELRI